VVHATVREPLGLRSITSDVADGPDRVAGHDATGRAVPDWHNVALAGCGSLWSTIDDLRRYLVANMRPETTALADALRMVHTPRAAAGPGREVGLGWIVSQADRGARHWHNGGTSGFGAFVGFNARAEVGVAVLTSRAHRPALDRAAFAVLAELEARVDGSGRLGV
jgi:serine-type D-Ala-D-Ala carboxypeptidase/endopeptidase